MTLVCVCAHVCMTALCSIPRERGREGERERRRERFICSLGSGPGADLITIYMRLPPLGLPWGAALGPDLIAIYMSLPPVGLRSPDHLQTHGLKTDVHVSAPATPAMGQNHCLTYLLAVPDSDIYANTFYNQGLIYIFL